MIRSFPSRLLPASAGFSAGAALLALAAGCANDPAAGSSSPGHVSLPAALSSRWSPPEFATRPVDGERAAVIEACVEAANSLGFSVSRVDGASGKVSAARRQSSGFDGARQDTLEIGVTTPGPGAAVVALVLREAVEPAPSDSERSGAIVTTSLVRDRAPYDAFFARLAAILRRDGTAPAAAPAAP